MPLYACPECHVVHAFEPTHEEKREANTTLRSDRDLDPDRPEYEAWPARKCGVCRKVRTFKPVQQ